MKTVNSDRFAEVLMGDLENLTDEMVKNVKEAVDDVANETKRIIDSSITFKDYGTKSRTAGKYRKSLRTKVTKETTTGKTVTWYASGQEYRLTHLLENGHKTRLGSGKSSYLAKGGKVRKSRTQAFPHISKGYDYVKENLARRIEEAINNAK